MKPIRISILAGHCGSPPAFIDCSLSSTDFNTNGSDVMIMTMVSGSRKNAWPITSMMLRVRCENRLFTMSMRMCSLSSSVQDATSRNTAPNSTHCSSSQEFDEVSNSLRMMALTADTMTAARISQAQDFADTETDRVDDAAHTQKRTHLPSPPGGRAVAPPPLMNRFFDLRSCRRTGAA